MSDRDRAALMRGSVVLLIAWLALRGGPALVAHIRHTEEEVAQQIDVLVRANMKLLHLDQLDDSIRVLEDAAQGWARALLAGEDVQTAAVDLMTRVGAEVDSRLVTLSRFGIPGVGERQAPLALATLPVHLETDFRELLSLLDALERHDALGLESITIEASDGHASDRAAEGLTVTLVVSGWYRDRATAADASLPAFVR